MVAGCPVDSNVIACVLSYQPDLTLLVVLAFVCAGCLWKFMDHQMQ
jgi:hypothetical protein